MGDAFVSHSGYPVMRCMDACFSFKHKSPSFGGGKSMGDSILSSSLFVEPKSSLIEHSTSNVEVKTCGGSFRAGKSSTRDPRCDKNAISASACRHAVLEHVVDVDEGEELLYAVTVFDEIVAKYGNSTFCLYYDIICKLNVHLLRHRPQGPSPNIQNLPLLHAFVHGKMCQLMYSPKMTMGTGHFDGEVIERVWSELETNVVGTQRTTLENRLDAITLMADYHAMVKNRSFLSNLEKNMTSLILRIVKFKLSIEDESLSTMTYQDTVSINMRNRYNSATNINKESTKPLLEDTSNGERTKIWAEMVDATIQFKELDIMAKTSKGAKNRARISGEKDACYNILKQLISEFNSLPRIHSGKTVAEEDGMLGMGVPPGVVVNEDVVEATFHGMLKEIVLETLSGNTNGIHEYFWRLLEDLYHHTVDLARTKVHFERQLLVLDHIMQILRDDSSNSEMLQYWEAAVADNRKKVVSNISDCIILQTKMGTIAAENGVTNLLLEVDLGFHQHIHKHMG